MLARIVIGILVGVLALSLAVVAWGAAMDRQMDSDRFVERLDRTPIPGDFTFVDEWALDGTWFIKSRSPEARRTYLTAGTVESTCVVIDVFYAERDLEISRTSRSDEPVDWCGRTVHIEGQRVSIGVEPIRSWTQVPSEVTGSDELVEVTYFASR